MSDLISREDLIDWLTSGIIRLKGIYGDLGGAVSGVREMVKVMPSVEPKQTTRVKVENQYSDYLPYSRFMESELRGICGKCGETVWQGEKFCHECGCKLEW